MPRYYVEMDGYRYGPFDLTELGQLRRDGVIPGGCRAAEEHSDANGTVDQLLAEHPMEDAGLAAEGTPSAATMADIPATDPMVEPEPTPAPAPVPAAPAPAAPSQTQTAAVQRISWSERLAQLRAQTPAPATPTMPVSAHAPVMSEPVSFIAERDTPPMEATPVTSITAPDDDAAKALPKPLLAEGSNIEPDVQYASALKEDPPAPISPDDTLPSLNLGGLSKPAVPAVNLDLPPLGYAASEEPAAAPQEWTNAPSPAANAAGFAESRPAFVFDQPQAPVAADASNSMAAPASPASPVELPEEPEATSLSEKPPSQPDTSIAAGLGGSWKERMSRLDEVYGASPKMASMPAGTREYETGGAPEPRLSATISEIAGEPRPEKDEESTAQTGSTLLAGIAVLMAGALGLMAGFDLMEVSAGPAMIMAGAMAAFGVITAIGGLLLCFGLRWAGIIAAVLLIVPLAVLGVAAYYQKDSFMELKIPAELMKPLTYGLASLLMSALGASLSRKSS